MAYVPDVNEYDDGNLGLTPRVGRPTIINVAMPRYYINGTLVSKDKYYFELDKLAKPLTQELENQLQSLINEIKEKQNKAQNLRNQINEIRKKVAIENNFEIK
jgi:peptidoglycan hydrolase CwlO-like protein